MAYVPGAKHDLFISYAHVDNEPDSHNTRWVSEFVRGLAVEIRQRLGGPKDFSRFFDESDLQAYHHLQILLENARQSAVFVAVLSPSYVSHDWTMKELREFASISSDTRRIVVVEKLPLEADDPYPTEIAQHKRTEFWRRNEPESYTPSTLTVHGASAQYRQKLEMLADQVQQLLRTMRKNAEEAQRREDEEIEERRTREAAAATEATGWNDGDRVRGIHDTHAGPKNQRVVDANHSLPPPEPSAKQATRQSGPAVNLRKLDKSHGPASPEFESLFSRLWPESEANGRLRLIALSGAVAAIALALSIILRSIVGLSPSPMIKSLAISSLALGGIAFLIFAADLGSRLGLMFAAIVAVVVLSVFSSDLRIRDATSIAGAVIGLAAAGIVTGFCIPRRNRGLWRRVFAMLMGCFAFAACVVVGIKLEEIQNESLGAAITSFRNNVGEVLGIIAGLSVAYSLISAGIYSLLRRLLMTARPRM